MKNICAIAVALTALTTAPAMAATGTTVQPPTPSLFICTGNDRAARKLTCIVDGDTGWQNGVKWRLLGVDTPEISEPACPREKVMGEIATDRLIDLMQQGYTITWSGEKGGYQRDLVTITVKGQDVGEILIAEGLAVPYRRGAPNAWC